MIKCPACEKTYSSIDELSEDVYVADVFSDGRASVIVTLRCPDFDCHEDIYEGNGQIKLYYYGG